MTIALIQSPLLWEDQKGNRERFAQKISDINGPVDLILLPEMFTTGFSMHPQKLAETMEGETVRWLKALAKSKDSAICASVIIKENGCFYNRLLFVFPTGDIQHYDKRHLFSLAGEDAVYTKGSERLIVSYKGFKICPLVCYDLRFPVFSRNTEDFDLILYVANWPKPRTAAWDILLKARAVENMCYVAGVNRMGTDANGHDYAGHSQIIDFLGNELVAPQPNEGVYITVLDREKMLETRKKLAFLEDRDSFKLE